MKLAAQPKVNTSGDYAFEGIAKHFKKILKYETLVKKDEDPEALHQMRVGMRRLRTAVIRFSVALTLPKAVSEKNIGKIARCLGNLRDLDVLKEALKINYEPHLTPKEQKILQTAFDALGKQRKDAVSDVQAILKDQSYKSLKQEMKDWLEKPTYQPLAAVKIQEILPDLLLPEVSQFLLHEGWLVGTEVRDSKLVICKGLDAEKIEKELATNGKKLHSLRKQAKRVRYQMELFTDFYGESYASYLADVTNIQEILGSIQDSMVLAEWLEDALKSKIHAQLPTLAAILAENRYQLWQQWQPLQQKYTKGENRQGLHLAILQPA